MKCYIAGPMRSKPQYNFPAFHAAAKALRLRGFKVFNPAELDEMFESNVTLTLTPAQQQQVNTSAAVTRRYVARDCHIIIHELDADSSDFMVTLPEWDKSTGAAAEVALAKWLHLPVFPLDFILSEYDDIDTKIEG